MQHLHRSMWKGNDPTRPKGLIHTYLRPTLPLKRFEYLLSSNGGSAPPSLHA